MVGFYLPLTDMAKGTMVQLIFWSGEINFGSWTREVYIHCATPVLHLILHDIVKRCSCITKTTLDVVWELTILIHCSPKQLALFIELQIEE
jgi:hypothetical protein